MVTKKEANRAVSDQAGLVVDTESELCQFEESNDVENDFLTVSQGKHGFRYQCSGETEGLNREIGEMRDVD